MRINNNIMALNTNRQLTINESNTSKSVQKLSSGYRINSAADDAAGLAISEKMRSQIRGLNQASRNSQDAISLVQTAEGALTETQSILQRMRELAVQSSSDTNTTVDRSALSLEFEALKGEINDISSNTKFNSMKLLDGSFGSGVDTTTSTVDNAVGVASVSAGGDAGSTYTFTVATGNLSVSDGTTTVALGTAASHDGAGTLNVQAFGISITTTAGFTGASLNGTTIVMAGSGGKIQTGANSGESMDIAIGAMDATTLGVDTASISDRANAQLALTSVDDAIKDVSTERAKLGAFQNRLDHKINNLNTSSENLTAAESRIRDVDMASEMSEYTKNNILSQAATSMLAQANNSTQSVLKLLQ